MVTLDLRIRRGRHAMRTTAAWFLPGAEPQFWWQEMSRWEVPHDCLRLRLVPSSREDRRPCGALVTVHGNVPVRSSGRCCPYGIIADRIYLPVDAVVEPQVSEPDLQHMLRGHHTVYVWHPVRGLVRFEPDDELTVADLFTKPDRRRADWNHGQAGTHVVEHLLSVEPLFEMSVAEIVEQGRDDIGSEPPSADHMPPPPPTHPRRSIRGISESVKKSVARAVDRLIQLRPATGPAPVWVESAQRWAMRQLTGLGSAVDLSARALQIQRLVDLLNESPDVGLRYALPFGRAGEHRGAAPPSSELPEQDVDLNLDGLQATGPADVWQLPAQILDELRRKYRELANREIRLGRYRRAAYIFAHLIGDYSAAASALKVGRFFREAAVLHLKYRKDVLAAAQCLHEGGFWSEAIVLYERCDQYETAGDLYRELQQEDHARQAYRKALEQLDPLRAARLLEEKLSAPEEALAALEAAWPVSQQAGQCLNAALEICGRQGWHEATARRVEQLRDGDYPPRHATTVADALARLTKTYPDKTVQDSARDAVRVVAGENLATLDHYAADELLEALEKTAAGDRLLVRDCNRFVWQGGRVEAGPGHARRARPARLVREFMLPPDVVWQTAINCGDQFLAAGFDARKLVLVRGGWDGILQERKVDIGPRRLDQVPRILQSVRRGQELAWWVCVCGCAPVQPVHFDRTDRFAALTAVTPSWVPPTAIGLAVAVTGIAWCIHFEDGNLVASAHRGGEIAWTATMPGAGETPPFVPVPILAAGADLVVGLDAQVLVRDPDQPSGFRVQTELGDRIVSLTGHERRLAGPVIVATADAGRVLWPYQGKSDSQWAAAATIEGQVFGFTRGRVLAAAADRELQYYRVRTEARCIRFLGSVATKLSDPVAVLPADTPRSIGIVSSDGEMHVYETP